MCIRDSSWSKPDDENLCKLVKTFNTRKGTFYKMRKEKDGTETTLDAELREVMDAKLWRLEAENREKKDKVTVEVHKTEIKEPDQTFPVEMEELVAEKQKSHQDQEVQIKAPSDNTKHQKTERITSRDILSMVEKSEMTYRQAETKFEELDKESSRKMTRSNIMDMMVNGELTMEESEIELRNLESRENEDNDNRNDKHNRNEPIRPDPVKTPEQQLPGKTHAMIVLPI